MFRYRMKKIAEVVFTLMALLSFVATSQPRSPKCPYIEAYGLDCGDTFCEPWSLKSGQIDWQTTWHTQEHKALRLLGEETQILGIFALPIPHPISTPISAIGIRAAVSEQAEVNLKMRAGNVERSFALLPGDWSEQVFEIESNEATFDAETESEPGEETGLGPGEETGLEPGEETVSIEISKTGKGEVLIYDLEFKYFRAECHPQQETY